MKKINWQVIVDLAIIVILGLTPLLWFHGNQIISGHDSGLPLYPVVHFVDRLNIWTQRLGFGFDQSIFIPGFFIHGLEALISSFGVSLQLEQKITFIIWFVLPGLTMYYLASKIARKCELTFFALPVSLLYMFNHFLLQGWFIAERTKFSLYIAMPLLLSFLFDWEEKKMSTLRAGLLISLTFFVLNGEGSIPLFGGVLVLLIVYTFFYFFNFGFAWKTIKRFFSLVILTLIASIFLNIYWLLPYMHFVSTSYQSQVMQAGGVSGVVGWVDYISQYSSLINLFRLQGIPDWYLNPQHAYAGIFLNNTLLVLVSYLIPIIAFLPLLLYKKFSQRKFVLFFAFLALFSMIFIAGSHPPFGSLYMLFVSTIPGFIAFRTPFYKFAPALWFAYAFLIGFSISYFLQKIQKKKVIAYIVYACICIAILGYNYPFFTGQFFNYMTARTMKITVPSYVFQFANWSMTPERKNIRTLALPNNDNGSDTFIESYTWHYWSPTPITSLLTNESIINAGPYLSQEESDLLRSLYSSMEENKPGWEKLARSLGIQSFLFRRDFVPNDKGSQDEDPKTYLNAIHSPALKLVEKFGQWEVYDFIDTTKEGKRITVSPLAYINGNTNDISSLASLPFFSSNDAFYIGGSTPKIDENLLQDANKIYTVSDCISCNLIFPSININSYIPVLIRKSIFYSLFNKNSTTKQLPSFHDALYNSLTDVMAFRKVIDEKRDTPVIISTINDYQNSLDVLYEVTQSYLKNNNNSVGINMSLVDAVNVIRNEKKVFSDRLSLLSDKGIYGISADAYKKLQDIGDLVNKNVWYTTDEVHKRFLIQAPKTNTYSLLYSPDTSVLDQKVTFSIDGSLSTVSATPQGDSWLSLGTISLTKGQHDLEVDQPINSLYSISSKQLDTSNNGSCYYLGPIKGEKDEIYRLTFQHKRLSGLTKFFVSDTIDTSHDNVFVTTGDTLKSEGYWQNYIRDYVVKNTNQPFYFSVCNMPLAIPEDSQASIQLQNILVRKITFPRILLYTSSGNENNIAVNNITIKKDTPMKYTFNTATNNNTNILSFLDRYDSGWKLEGNNNHFVVNGFANGWMLNKNENSGVITFGPQELVSLGFKITGCTLLVILGIFLIKRKKL